MADSVQLTDLDVITKYSIAVRKASADRDELIETLRADLNWLERGVRRTRAVAVPEPEFEADDEEYAGYEDELDEAPEPKRAPIRRMPASVTPARKTAARKSAAKKTTAKKTATRRSSR
jgi:hypothetical protein